MTRIGSGLVWLVTHPDRADEIAARRAWRAMIWRLIIGATVTRDRPRNRKDGTRQPGQMQSAWESRQVARKMDLTRRLREHARRDPPCPADASAMLDRLASPAHQPDHHLMVTAATEEVLRILTNPSPTRHP